MVQFTGEDVDDKKPGALSVTDVVEPAQLLQNTQTAARNCRGRNEELPIPEDFEVVDSVIVVGSYGRGQAIPGESDLDILAPMTRDKAYMGPLMSNLAGACMEDEQQETLLQGVDEAVQEVDVIGVPQDDVWEMAISLSSIPARGDKNLVYKLGGGSTGRPQLMDLEGLMELLIGQIEEEELGFDDVDMEAMRLSNLTDRQISEIEEALTF